MPHLTSNTPSAKATLQTLKAELTRKGLKSALDRLPPISAINISPQNFSPSEHPYKLHLGSKHSSPIYATLGPRPRNPSHAPELLFFAGSTSTSMAQLPSFNSLETVALIEPFRTFWEKSRDMVGARGRKDERRGQFKGLVYWYFLGEAVRRGGGLRVAGTVGGYVVRAVGRLGMGVRDGRRRGTGTDGTENIADVLGEVERIGERQRKVEDRVRLNIEDGNTAGFGPPAKTSRKPGDDDTGQKGSGEPRRERGIPSGVLRQDNRARDERLFPYLGRPAKVHDNAHNARRYERHVPENTYRGAKRKRAVIERDTESEAQFTDNQSNAWESTEEEEQPRTSKRRRHAVYTPSPDYTREPAHSFQGRERAAQSYQPPRMRKRPDRYKTSEHTRRSITRLNTGPLVWDERLGRHTPIADNGKNPPSTPPTNTTLPKADPPPTHAPPRPSNTDPEFSSAQYISSMKKALLKTEELDADLASIEEEERRLRIEKEDLDTRRKKAQEALQDNHAAIQCIAEGIARGGSGEKGT